MSRPVLTAILIALLAVAGPARVTSVSAPVPAALAAVPAAAIVVPAAADPARDVPAPGQTEGEGAGAPVAYIGQGWG